MLHWDDTTSAKESLGREGVFETYSGAYDVSLRCSGVCDGCMYGAEDAFVYMDSVLAEIFV